MGTLPPNATAWICNACNRNGYVDFCILDRAQSFEDNWIQLAWEAPHQQAVEVDYCLINESEDNNQRCSLHLSVPALSLVCFSTLLGSFLVLTTSIKVNEPTLVRLGTPLVRS
jgi:hypothetical protein